MLITVPAHMSLWSYFDVSACHCRRYERPELMARLAETGFRVEYATEFMTAIFPLVWPGRRWRGRGTGPGRAAAVARADRELTIVPGINAALKFLLGAEATFVARRWRLPRGHPCSRSRARFPKPDLVLALSLSFPPPGELAARELPDAARSVARARAPYSRASTRTCMRESRRMTRNSSRTGHQS